MVIDIGKKFSINDEVEKQIIILHSKNIIEKIIIVLLLLKVPDAIWACQSALFLAFSRSYF